MIRLAVIRNSKFSRTLADKSTPHTFNLIAATHRKMSTLADDFDPSQDYFAKLGLQQNATDEDIKQEFYKKAKKYHPDLATTNNLSGNEIEQNEEKFKELNSAYEILSNQEKKSAYVRQRQEYLSGKRDYYQGSSQTAQNTEQYSDYYAQSEETYTFNQKGNQWKGQSNNQYNNYHQQQRQKQNEHWEQKQESQNRSNSQSNYFYEDYRSRRHEQEKSQKQHSSSQWQREESGKYTNQSGFNDHYSDDRKERQKQYQQEQAHRHRQHHEDYRQARKDHMNGGSSKKGAFSGVNFLVMKIVTALVLLGFTKEMINGALSGSKEPKKVAFGGGSMHHVHAGPSNPAEEFWSMIKVPPAAIQPGIVAQHTGSMDLNKAMPLTQIKDYSQSRRDPVDKFKPSEISSVIITDLTAASPFKEKFNLTQKDDLSMLDPKELKCLLSGVEIKHKDKNKQRAYENKMRYIRHRMRIQRDWNKSVEQMIQDDIDTVNKLLIQQGEAPLRMTISEAKSTSQDYDSAEEKIKLRKQQAGKSRA